MIKKVLFLLFLCFACESEYFSRIPDYPVALELDINLTDTELNPMFGSKTFTTKRVTRDYLGYGGILVFHGADAFYAYDMACPYEIKSTIKVAVYNTIQAKCPKCGSTFNISDGTGSPYSGPAKENGYYLRRYTISQNASSLYVYK